MTTKEVMFDSVEDVKRFVQQSEKQPEDIDVCCGSCMVDGKSILGKDVPDLRASFFNGLACRLVLHCCCIADLKGRFYNEPFL